MQVCTTYNGGQRTQAESEAILPAEMRSVSVRENTKKDSHGDNAASMYHVQRRAVDTGRERSDSAGDMQIVLFRICLLEEQFLISYEVFL